MKTQSNKLAIGLLILLVASLSGCASADKAVVESAAGGMDLSQQLMGYFGDFGKIMGSVKDTESAEQAIPQLDSLDANLDSLANSASAASPEVQNSLSEVATAQIPGLSAITDKVYAIPGVKPVVKPPVDRLLSKFTSFM
jgi:hypothetical protein